MSAVDFELPTAHYIDVVSEQHGQPATTPGPRILGSIA
jgi:hypothetical protein